MIYRDMSAGDMLQALGDDAMKWADAFCEQHPDADREVMFGWFANAIENTWDVRCGRVVRDDTALLDHMSALIRTRDLCVENAEHYARPWLSEPPAPADGEGQGSPSSTTEADETPGMNP